MSFPGRDDGSRSKPIFRDGISQTVSDMNLGPWISSLLLGVMQSAEFANNDFMGRSDDIVSLQEVIEAMTYYATVVGYKPTWEISDTPSIFEDFRRRPGVFKAMCKKVDNWSTIQGSQKLAAVKRRIRESVHQKGVTMLGKPSSLGVFAEGAADMEAIYNDTNYVSLVRSLHQLGTYPQENPRFYTHMIYRYYVNEFHKQLADEDKVIRFPSLQKVMDIRLPVGCLDSTPPEFRMFLKNARGNCVRAVTLPVPSKTETNMVVYRHNFEATVPWVPVMRARIFTLFEDLSAESSPDLFRQIYPKYLVKGEGGCEKGNREVAEALARSIAISNIAQTIGGLQDIGEATEKTLTKILTIDSTIGDIFPRYNSHPFRTEGEQLRERIGFLLQDSIRGVFRRIASKMSSFCNDIYASLGMSYDTMDVFTEYCTTKTSMKYLKRQDTEWRDFVIDTRKILCVLHAWSRKSRVDRFTEKYGTTEEYLRGVFKKLE